MEEGAFVLLELHFELYCGLDAFLEWLNASIILPDEPLKFGGSICKLGTSLRKNLVGVRLVHVVGHSFTSLMHLVSFDEASRKRIVLLKLVVASGLIVTEYGSNSKVL